MSGELAIPELLMPLIDAVFGHLSAAAIVSARPLGLAIVFPLFTQVRTGVLIRSGFALGLSLPILTGAVAQMDGFEHAGSAFHLAFLAAKETFVGLLLGLLLGVPFWGVQAVGEVMDTQREVMDTQREVMSGAITEPGTNSEISALSLHDALPI